MLPDGKVRQLTRRNLRFKIATIARWANDRIAEEYLFRNSAAGTDRLVWVNDLKNIQNFAKQPKRRGPTPLKLYFKLSGNFGIVVTISKGYPCVDNGPVSTIPAPARTSIDRWAD